jgi:DNA repair protein RadC
MFVKIFHRNGAQLVKDATDFHPLIGVGKNTMTQQESDLSIELAAPARRALYEAGYLRLEQLTKVSETELKQLHGIGPNAIKQLRRALGAKGLSLADEKTRKERG